MWHHRYRAQLAGCALTALLIGLTGCEHQGTGDQGTEQDAPAPEQLVAEVVRSQPWNREWFTQGFEADGDGWIVGTGEYGGSAIYRLDAEGKPSASKRLSEEFFGEGITRHGDAIWQLTWQEHTAVLRDARTLDERSRVHYEGEGWGLCSFPDVLVMSDGSGTLQLRDPATFALRSTVDVTLPGTEVSALNELECVERAGAREVYANVFLDPTIYRIDLAQGDVTGVIDASGVPNHAAADPNNVLNGIAHREGEDTFWITGKRWPDLYEVRFVAKSAHDAS